ncbi:hypothetical protein G4D82_08150 [Flavobacterium sp. CYK-4]|uniref:hypothetical protein n=1 Tax=Flavobacterium lotistagni TaxID=2709660 RepID=UPI00140AAD90|nr:hypothetical protein [Flavobacterium lotistagni]NHM07191.1 hypothetical protein [Flavobacterium lotistagni]
MILKKMQLFRWLFLLVSVVFFSCEDEPVDPQPKNIVSTLECSVPSNVTITRSTDTSMATLLWESSPDQHSWQIQYGSYGFVLGSGTNVYSTATSKIFIGLQETAGYDFYIRSICSENVFSEWIGPYTLSPVGVILTSNYWPMAQQNQWVFSIDNINQAPWKIVTSETISGNTYYTYQSIDGKPVMKTRKTDAGEYYLKYENYSDGLGQEITGNETIVLKDNLPVGSSWTDSYIETVTQTGLPPEDSNVEIVSSIIARDATLTVPGGSFTNVIVVKRVKTVTAADLSVSTSTTTYYFAKDHGPIQIKTEAEDGTVTLEKLTAHILY